MGPEFSDEQIHRTTWFARDHGFDSGRAQNASYGDTLVFECEDQEETDRMIQVEYVGGTER